MNGAVRDCPMADVGMNVCVLGVKYVLNGFEVGNGPYDPRFSLSQGAAVAAFMAVWVCFV